MKLVFITDAWRPITGGGQKLYEEVLVRLAKRGWKITVITRDLPGDCVSDRLPAIRLGPRLSFFNPVGRLWFIFSSFFYCLKFSPDVFMATTWLPAITLQLIKLFKKSRVVLLAIGFGSKYQWVENLITRKFKYDLIITDDWTFKQAKFIPNGVDIPKPQKVTKWKNFTFLFIGRNEPRKGADILKQAFSKVKLKFPGARLRLFGPGFKLISGVQLHQEMFKAHFLVLPSRREGHPLILFEAWAHRLPVIATKVGSVPQFVSSQNGYLVEPGSADALAEAMIQAINNQDLSSLGQSGFDLVKNYTWAKTAAAYANSLASLLGFGSN